MNAPVTHGQLHAALEIWGGAFLAALNELRNELRNDMRAMEQRLTVTLTAMTAVEIGASEQRF